ncbi:hypothetical protein [Priestia koreensis]|uniref:hypothetical protein n=1 Tax=Priestia koreensis TaxID=284581 RepID=UPI003458C035
MPLNPEDSKKFNELRENLRYADTVEEVDHYSEQLSEFRKELRAKGHVSITDLLTDDERIEYQELRTELKYATSISEVDYYADEIEKLFDRVRARDEVRLAKDENSATAAYAY